MAKYSGSGWHNQSIRHSNARKYGKAGGKYITAFSKEDFMNIKQNRQDYQKFKKELIKKHPDLSNKKIDAMLQKNPSKLWELDKKKHYGKVLREDVSGLKGLPAFQIENEDGLIFWTLLSPKSLDDKSEKVIKTSKMSGELFNSLNNTDKEFILKEYKEIKHKKHYGEAEKGETAGQILERLSTSSTSSETDSKIMQALLQKTGLYPNAVVVMGIVYLDGKGTMKNPPTSIHTVAKTILRAVEDAKKGKHYGVSEWLDKQNKKLDKQNKELEEKLAKENKELNKQKIIDRTPDPEGKQLYRPLHLTDDGKYAIIEFKKPRVWSREKEAHIVHYFPNGVLNPDKPAIFSSKEEAKKRLSFEEELNIGTKGFGSTNPPKPIIVKLSRNAKKQIRWEWND